MLVAGIAFPGVLYRRHSNTRADENKTAEWSDNSHTIRTQTRRAGKAKGDFVRQLSRAVRERAGPNPV